ncbi:TlpA disulfide reductase family protein [Dyadobacter sp. NIV53]|uniref:TlpA family protein disulfide reductase n=1 Tax=Dyadobacter sp. NIV53 TaxID=2861765 RepID=UPI001C86E68F|nr:TlpA disulfide reductase family protein [Dyadobacter sp. NIV53]
MKKIKTVFLLLTILIFGSKIQAQETRIRTGEMAPEIELPNIKGEKTALSSLRGNLVLIDFWATWCAPCVEEQPELKKLYTKYNHLKSGGIGLEIFGVSLDNKKEAWEKSIRKFNMAWVQVSDLKYWTSPVAQTYHIEALPYNVLVDEKGFIIALNLHGKELEGFIDSYLKKE